MFDNHAFPLWLALLVLSLLLAIWLAAVHSRTRRLEGRLEEALGGVSGDNAAKMLTEYLATVRSTASAVDRIRQEHDRLSTLMPSVVRHVGLVRFSPFHDTGGDQSFSLAFLDSRRDGVVVTGLHSRSDSRLYAKPIEAGDSHYALIPEEREAIQVALSAHPVAEVVS